MLRQLTDEFSIQDIPQQQIRLSRFRAIKASLFRCMKDGAGQAIDCYVRQLLVAIAAFFRSLLKSSHSAAEQLNSEFSTYFTSKSAWGLFLESPGNLMGRKQYFEIKVSRKEGCVLASNEVHFVAIANNFTV